jgi:nucleotide-binding universal stress UspA family protein
MFRHILVPLDGSGMAEAALQAASFLAEKFNAPVTLLHVIEKNAPREVHGQRHLTDVKEATAYLERVARHSFSETVHVNIHVHSDEAENVAAGIVEHSGELHYDLIVMCSHGRGRALHLLLGSIAEKVISMGTLPVLLIRLYGDGNIAPFSCNSLLLPLDGDPEHEKALPAAKALARVCRVFIHLAVVIPGMSTLSGKEATTSRFLPGTMSRILEMSVEKAEEYLQSQLKALREENMEADARVLRGDPAAVIDNAALALKVDLIVMATHGKAGMDAFWSGSVGHKVSSRSRVPMLLIPVSRGASSE